MDGDAATWWWLAAGVLVAAELASGSFYLLMLALGCAAGAVAAMAGLGGVAQISAAALLGGGATAAWHIRRARSPRSAPADANRDLLLDIGETVMVASWEPDGTTRVHHRGADWTARFSGPGTPGPGRHRIVALQGNQLSVAADPAA